jgi:hypothetical protein
MALRGAKKRFLFPNISDSNMSGSYGLSGFAREEDVQYSRQ